MKHKIDNFNYDDFDRDRWESRKNFVFISLANGDWGCSFPPEDIEDTYDFKLFIFEAQFFRYALKIA
eukprot:SAG11_NODE_16239_length_553_cov_1.288546_1_plen_67_part_00